MSKCMTIADETVDQKDICLDIAPKEIVEFILEEALLSAVIVSDKGCSRIGDSNITGEFRQQYDQLSLLKDFEQVEPSQAQPAANKDSNLNFRENLDRAAVTAKENLEQIIDSFVKEEEKAKPLNDCQIISEELLADNELQIKNGQIHIEKNKTITESETEDYFDKKDVIKDEKIEIEYFNKGQLNRIYVPLNGNGEEDGRSNDKKEEEEEEIGLNERNGREDNERPFKPYTTEELRQVWENGNSSFVGRWDGDMLKQRDEVVRIMEELSSVQVFPDSFADPNRPRACAFGEEDVKKMTKEIEDINFTQSHALSEDTVSFHPDGQGDADLESENVEKSQNECFNSQTRNQNSTEEEIRSQTFPIPPLLNDEITKSMKIDLPFNTEPSEPGPETNDPDLTPDIEAESLSKKPSQIIRSGSNYQPPQQGTISWSGLKWGSKEALCTLNPNTYLEENHWERISVEYRPLPEEAEEKVEADDFLRTEGSEIQNGDDANLVAEKVNERLEDTLVCAEKNVENFEKLVERVCEDEAVKPETEDEYIMNGASFDFTQTAISEQQSKHTLNSEQTLSNTETNRDPSDSAQTSQTQFSDQSTKGSETLVSGSQKFKLHSPKMYMGPYHEPAGPVLNEFSLTESEEAFIDMSENVLQIIDPPDNSADEDSNVISFTIIPETNLKPVFHNVENKSEISLKRDEFRSSVVIPATKNIEKSENEAPTKKVYSGMTTIGPMKNLDYDPKDLTAPEIDFGKMTRITSSRQLARDMGLLNAENPALSVKIIEEDDSDDNTTLNLEDDHNDRNSLINRDIASYTKVQKVREVMSHQAKPEEGFDDEDSLPRPRLDLKDVESMTDERYKFPDVSIPLFSLEIGEGNLEAEKELMESMGLVISGLTNTCFYEEERENDLNFPVETPSVNKTAESLLEVNKQSSKTESLIEKNEEENLEEEKKETEILETELKDETSENPKHSTLGNVFRKASSKFMRKDSELYMRNSKSLPWDTSKMSATSSIRSILDDCQSSASSVLKKSCSFLKNTESIFKSISQSMVITEKSSESNAAQKKLSPSESDVSTVERKFSGFFKKEDFTKAKNLIKSKVEKTFKSSDSRSSIPEKKELQVAVRNEENMRLDRIENVKKFLPKSPLVYKSQFVKSPMNFHSQPEPLILNPPALEPIIRETVNSTPTEGSDAVPAIEKEMTEEPHRKESLQWITKEENLQLPIFENLEPQQPAYIVMETIQGLPPSDLESPSSEKENLNVETGNVTTQKRNDVKKIEASNSLQLLTESSQDIVPCYTDTDEEKTTKTSSERKIKTKKKKLSARFLSFWCSAFGRARTPQKKGELS